MTRPAVGVADVELAVGERLRGSAAARGSPSRPSASIAASRCGETAVRRAHRPSVAKIGADGCAGDGRDTANSQTAGQSQKTDGIERRSGVERTGATRSRRRRCESLASSLRCSCLAAALALVDGVEVAARSAARASRRSMPLASGRKSDQASPGTAPAVCQTMSNWPSAWISPISTGLVMWWFGIIVASSRRSGSAPRRRRSRRSPRRHRWCRPSRPPSPTC